jgi:hypothetical protein
MTLPRSSKNSSVGVNCTFSTRARSFSRIVRPSIHVTSRSPQMFSAVATKCRRVFSTIACCEKLTVISFVQ